MVRIRRSQRRGPGSIPGVGTIILNLYYFIKRFHFRLTAVVVFFYCPIEEEDWVTFFCVPTFRNRHFRFKVFSLKKSTSRCLSVDGFEESAVRLKEVSTLQRV